MNAAQVNGIKNFGVGTQIQTVGHESTSKIGAQHTHLETFDLGLHPAKAFVTYLKKHHPEVPAETRERFRSIPSIHAGCRIPG